jgi:hypothetical protein
MSGLMKQEPYARACEETLTPVHHSGLRREPYARACEETP